MVALKTAVIRSSASVSLKPPRFAWEPKVQIRQALVLTGAKCKHQETLSTLQMGVRKALTMTTSSAEDALRS